jgi:DNA-binding SARP family transcriptional activator
VPQPSFLPPDLPQADRLIRRLLALDGPLIQLWAWPGSGDNALLGALCAALPALARPLCRESTAEGPALRAAIAEGRCQGASWFVAMGLAPAALAAASDALLPGERLVYAAPRLLGSTGPRPALLPPAELLLEPRELCRLWRHATGEEPAPALVAHTHAATDGWYRPLCDLLAATGGAGLDGATAEDLVELPVVRSFLGYEVLAPLSEPQRARLCARAAAEEEGEETLADAAAEPHGLWIDDGGTERLPRLLAAYLRRERRRRSLRSPSVVAPAAAAASSASRAADPVPAPPASAAAPAGKTTYSLVLFGSPVVRRRDARGERPLECKLRRSLQVLAFLASAPDLEADRDALVEAIWPNEGERTVERNFHPTLSYLRRMLEAESRAAGLAPPLLFRGGVYRLNPEIEWEIDTREMQRRNERGRQRLLDNEVALAVADWSEAWRLYRGPFLHGFFETWVAERRERLQEQYLDMLCELGAAYVRLERPGEALDAYRAVLVENPLEERIHVSVMRLYAQQGRRDLVKRQYDRLCALLMSELGEAPLAQTSADFHALMGS